MKRAIYALLGAYLVLTGCTSTPQTPAQAVYAAHGTYTVALTAAVNYKALPPCVPEMKQLACKEAKVVSQLQQADDQAYAALNLAQRLVRAGESPQAQALAIDSAVRAVGAFAAIAQRLGSQP